MATDTRGSINGMPIRLGKKKITIKVTDRDVTASHGHERDAGACAAAHAACRLPNVKAARVHLSRTYLQLKDSEHWLLLETPRALRTELAMFDRAGAKHFQPGEYTLMPLRPSEASKFGKRQGSNAPGARDRGSKNRTPKRPRAKPHVMSGVRHFGANR